MPDAGFLCPPKGLPDVHNVPMALKNTEYPFTLPSGTRSYTVKFRSGLKVKLAYESGKSNIEYLSIFGSHSEQGLDPLQTVVLYMRATKDGEVAEILTWK